MNDWFSFTLIACGVFWSASYVFMIVRAIKDKKVAMPIWSWAMNLSWECFYFFVYLRLNSPLTFVFLFWMCLDFVLTYLLLKHNQQYYPEHLKKFFYPLVGAAFATCLAMQFAFYFGSERGITYSAFPNNLIASISILAALLQVRNLGPKEALRGHDLYAAICKMVGTIFVAFYNGIFAMGQIDWFIFISGILILIFDILYIIAIGVELSKLKKEKDYSNEEVEEKS